MTLVDVARAGGSLAEAADAHTRLLIDGFLHQAGPPPARFAWVVLGSHARGELHCASDQDHALFWEKQPAGSYAADLAATVIEGLEQFGMRRAMESLVPERSCKEDAENLLHNLRVFASASGAPLTASAMQSGEGFSDDVTIAAIGVE